LLSKGDVSEAVGDVSEAVGDVSDVSDVALTSQMLLFSHGKKEASGM